MKVQKVVECLKEPSKCLLIGTTSIQRFYIEDLENVVADAESETVEYDYKGLHYIIDMTDIDIIVMNPNNMKINGLTLP